MDEKRAAKENRERARQKELKNNPGGSLRDGVDGGAGNENVTDIAGYVIYQFFFN